MKRQRRGAVSFRMRCCVVRVWVLYGGAAATKKKGGVEMRTGDELKRRRRGDWMGRGGGRMALMRADVFSVGPPAGTFLQPRRCRAQGCSKGACGGKLNKPIGKGVCDEFHREPTPMRLNRSKTVNLSSSNARFFTGWCFAITVVCSALYPAKSSGSSMWIKRGPRMSGGPQQDAARS